MADVEIYRGKIYHIFFHSLILYPELAFDGENAARYNDWMTTKREYKAILKKLYENDFLLADIGDVYGAIASGKGLKFPKGKKPLIISVDDVNYYDYMKNDGFAEKLVVDRFGGIAALVKTPNDGYIVDYEGDAAPILERFLEEYPDFSYNGARGILAVTGYQGVFGYRITTLKGSELSKAIEDAKAVAAALKNKGWKIACHSYSHSSAFKNGAITEEKLKEDTAKWQDKIAPIIGNTDIYIPPFGIHFPENGSLFEIIKKSSYNVYCPVYKDMNTRMAGGVLISERLNFDGFTMTKHPERIEKYFFKLDGIIDPSRALTKTR